jgi:hypothetical protein
MYRAHLPVTLYLLLLSDCQYIWYKSFYKFLAINLGINNINNN